jgi:3alpha(or 20beta)-hydroxysteroid dehydrogenase
MTQLAGKVALITGAARGQGAAEARLFAARGARVVLTDVLEEEGRAVAAELGDAARFVRHDVTAEGDWAQSVATALAEFGGLDVLVNNAGVYRMRFLESETAEDFRSMLDINVVGAFLGIRTVVPALRERGGGVIVNVSSITGMQGTLGHSAYSASKWALRGLTRAAALELGVDGIRVNSVHPGTIDTPMHAEGAFERGGAYPLAPLNRVGEADEVAELVAFLASNAAGYLSGAEITVDGGMAAGPVWPMPSGRRAG